MKQTAVETSISPESRSTEEVVASNFLGHMDKLLLLVREMKNTMIVRMHIPVIVTIFILNGCDKDKASDANAFHT